MAANRLAGEVLGRSLDEMPPQTRSFLETILAAVRRECAEKQIEQRSYRFTQRDVRGWTNASPQQVKRHLAKLVDLEYALIHRGGRGQCFVYEILYQGEGEEGGKFVMGLIDTETLKESGNATYDGNRNMQNGHRDTPGSPQVQGLDTGSLHAQNGHKPSNHAGLEPMRDQKPENTQPGPEKKPAHRNRRGSSSFVVGSSSSPPMPPADAPEPSTNHQPPTTN